MNAKKKIFSIALAASLAAVAVVGSSLAYFTDKDEKANTLTIGNVDITLTEPGWDATGKEEAKEMYPGEAVAKDPTVTNNGKTRRLSVLRWSGQKMWICLIVLIM